MDLENFKKICENTFRFHYKGDIEDELVFWYRNKTEYSVQIKKEKLENLIENLNHFNTNEETELHNETYYEVPLVNSGRPHMTSSLRNGLEKEDLVNNIRYEIGLPTDNYIVFIIEKFKNIPAREFRSIGYTTMTLMRVFEQDEKDFLKILASLFPRFLTIKISSTSIKRINEFRNLSYSFIFTLNYNLDITYMPVRYIDEFSRKVRVGRIRRGSIEEVEAPKRKFSNDLILYYQRGTSSESTDNQFLSFYHVLEHFFEKIYQDEIINSIKNELTSPSFSYKRTKDINKLIKVIKKKLRYRNEEFLLNEQEALLLTLKKFIINIDELKDELISFDHTLIEYYKNNEISFSKGNKVDFNNVNKDIILSNLAKRIYKTRNAIVHSKESEHSKYLPFNNDKELTKEIYLMRLLAETIIISSSQEL